MKPRLRFARGMWWCGYRGDHHAWWSCAPTPAEAFELWERCQK